MLYLLFNEGHLSAHAEEAIRRELCDEAVRLTTLLAEHPIGAAPETFALLGLMHLHAARLGARLNEMGGLLLLEEQDRSLWDRERMRIGAEWLARSASGKTFSRFHAEAGIAAEHCFAPAFEHRRWKEIADLYAMLERIDPSPLHTMNRAVVVAEWQGPDAGLAMLEALAPPMWLAGSYLSDVVLGDLHRRAENTEIAQRHRDRTLDSSTTEAVRHLLRRRLVIARGQGQPPALAGRVWLSPRDGAFRTRDAEAAFAELDHMIERLRSFNISADQFQCFVVDAERRPVRGHWPAR